jgi:23S rRNA (guanosine2251-2'-O)-methyltransferase
MRQRLAEPSGQQWLAGWHAVLAALHARQAKRVVCAVPDEGSERHAALYRLSAAQGIAVERWDRRVLDGLLPGVVHQGVACLHAGRAQFAEQDLPDLLASMDAAPLLLGLDAVQDPRNLGACLRSAAAFGAGAVVVPQDRSAPLSAVARKAASGAAELLPYCVVPNLARALQCIKEHNVWIYGLDGTGSVALPEVDLRGPVMLLAGGEGKGLRQLTRKHCDVLVRIPTHDVLDTLNVSVAVAIALYEVQRQRGMQPEPNSHGKQQGE